MTEHRTASGVAVTDEAKGWRDVYWCHLLNEPVIVEYRRQGDAHIKFCVHCDGDIDALPTLHTFCFHIAGKPRMT